MTCGFASATTGGCTARSQSKGHNIKLGAGGHPRDRVLHPDPAAYRRGPRPIACATGPRWAGWRRLPQKGWVPHEVAEDADDLYRAHREVEHRLQMVNDAQTHSLPADGRRCRPDRRVLRPVRGRVPPRPSSTGWHRTDRLTEGFFAPARSRGGAPDLSGPPARSPGVGKAIPALRIGPRAGDLPAIFGRGCLRELARAANPDEALVALDGFLQGLPAGVQIFSLFEANPTLIELIVDIAGLGPRPCPATWRAMPRFWTG